MSVHEPYLFAPFPDGRKVVTWSSREDTCAAIERDWSAADAAAYREFAERWEGAPARARPLMLEPPDRERWLEAVGEGILDGSIAAELEGFPSEPVQVPFAIQGLIGTLAGPEDPGTAFVGFYHDLGEAAGVPGAWGYARGGMGAVTAALRSAAEAAGARVRLETPVERVLVEDGRACGLVLDGGEEVRAGAVVSNADPLTTARLAGVEPARRMAAGGAGREGDAAARRAARLPELARAGAVAGRDRHRLHDGRPGAGGRRRPRRAARGAPVDRGGVPDGRRRQPRAARAATSCRCSASAFRRTWTRRRRRTRRSRASPRSARSCPTGSSSGSRSGRASSRRASGSRAATSSTARCCRASCSRSGTARSASAASRASTWPGSGAHPGGAVTGAPGYLAAQAVLAARG